MAEVACHMANLDRHLARHLGHLFCDLLVDWGGSSRNLDETQATPRFCSPIVRFCIQLRKHVKNRKSKPVKKSCTCERTRPLSATLPCPVSCPALFRAPKFTIQTYGEMGTRVLAIWWVPGPESAKIYCARRCLLILFTRCRLIFSHLGAAAIGVSDYFRDIVHIYLF